MHLSRSRHRNHRAGPMVADIHGQSSQCGANGARIRPAPPGDAFWWCWTDRVEAGRGSHEASSVEATRQGANSGILTVLPRRQIGRDGRRQASGQHLRSSKHRRPRRSSRPRCPRACAASGLSELRSASLGGEQLRLFAKQRPPLLLVDVAHPAERVDVRPVVSGLIGPGREGEATGDPNLHNSI